MSATSGPAPALVWPEPPSGMRPASGWQQVTFATPVAIRAGTTYVASYYAPVGHYAYNYNYFALSGVDNGVLHALSNNAGGGNGVYLYATYGGFPTNTWASGANYWVDVVFSSTLTNQPVAIPAPTGTPSLYVTAKLTQMSGHSVIACIVKDSAGQAVVSQIVSVEKAAAASRTIYHLDVKKDKRERPSPPSLCAAKEHLVRAMLRSGLRIAAQDDKRIRSHRGTVSAGFRFYRAAGLHEGSGRSSRTASA